MHWDDLRIASAILRGGSYAAAAKQLGLNETTVSRRLARLERDLGTKIFHTVDGERAPTEAGRHVLRVVRQMKVESDKLANLETAGKPIVRRRIASVEAMATHFLAPSVSTLIKQHPHLQIEILLSTELASFSRWETDIALRLVRPERGNVVMRKLADFEWVLVQPANSEPRYFCGYTSQHVQKKERDVLRSHLPGPLPMIVVNGMSPMKKILTNGDGIGFLPDFMCNDLWHRAELSLQALDLYRPIWLLVQEHLRDDPDTTIVTDWLVSAFKAT
ncbi:MAG: LysR family transcriptional regulator [Parvularcula sp.]|jgi:DNA-binding transcriptional LysR family regulator|nr:LysR family transcriptional regulator [Parvularcula sp.]